MCIDIPLGSTTTLELGLDGLVTLVTVPLTGVGGLEEVLPAATQGKELVRDFEIIIKIKHYASYRASFMLGPKNRATVEVWVVYKIIGSLKSLLSLLPVLDGLGMAAFFSACRLAI